MASRASKAARVGLGDGATARIFIRRSDKNNNNFVVVDLPHHLLLEILSRVPVKYLLRFKRVCKSWYNTLTHDTHFITMHLNQSIKNRHYCFIFSNADLIFAVDYFRRPFTYKVNLKFLSGYKYNFTVIQSGSCHGLFLIRRTHLYHRKSVLCLWNPATRQYKKLPSARTEIHKYRAQSRNIFVCGLGYDSCTNDYKVIQIRYYFTPPNDQSTRGHYADSDVHVYSMRKRNSVKRIQDIPYKVEDVYTPSGIFLNKSIHWLFRMLGGPLQIVAFDVTKEEFEKLPMPDLKENTSEEVRRSLIGDLKDRLCLYHLNKESMDVFMMNEYGIKESWMKLYAIPLNGNPCKFFKALFFNYKEEVILQISPDAGPSHLVAYKPEEGDPTHLAIDGIPQRSMHYYQFQPYVESLVSLKSTTFMWETK